MRRRLKNTLIGATTSVVFAVLSSGVAYSAEGTVAKEPAGDAAKTLQSILEKAGEQGFLRLEGQESPQETASEAPQAVDVFDASDANCSLSSIFNLTAYQEVTSFDDVFRARKQLETADKLDDVLSLAKTYMALGLGAELTALAEPFGDDARSKLLQSAGRLVEGYPTDTDRERFQKYSACNINMSLWGLVSKASGADLVAELPVFTMSPPQRQLLEDLPPGLESVFTARLGIYAAETKAVNIAEQFLSNIEPRAVRGHLPSVRSDERLYFYGLVRKLKGDPAANQVFKYLGQYDGNFRARAMRKLVEETSANGTEIYGGFPEDLLAIRQQYMGKKQGRAATLDIVRHWLKDDKYISAINITKEDLNTEQPERAHAVAAIADHILQRLESDSAKVKVFAINGYLYDRAFYSIYSGEDTLKTAVFDNAIELNLPELALLVVSDPSGDSLRASQADFAKAKLALKHGEYDKVLNVSNKFAGETAYKPLRLEAAMQTGNDKVASSILSAMPASAERSARYANIAMQKGQWREAGAALETLDGKSSNGDVEAKIAITKYVGPQKGAYLNRAVPTTAEGLDEFKDQVSGDIEVVKAYLSNG